MEGKPGQPVGAAHHVHQQREHGHADDRRGERREHVGGQGEGPQQRQHAGDSDQEPQDGGTERETATGEDARDGGEQQGHQHHAADQDRLVLGAELRTAHSFMGVGVRSMTVDPTASTGEDAGFIAAATR